VLSPTARLLAKKYEATNSTRELDGFEISETCETGKLRANGLFRNLAPTELTDFRTVRSGLAHSRGALLFMEAQYSRGMIMLCEGPVAT
jgi:hypothetical protein